MPKGKASTGTYIVEVAPLSKSSLIGNLSYFSTTKLLPGTLVKVLLRNSLSLAVVLNSKSAYSAKSEIRRAGFALKKISEKNVLPAGFHPAFMKGVMETSVYYAMQPGLLLYSMVPKMLLESPEQFFKNSEQSKDNGKAELKTKETFFVQMEVDERFGQYRALIRQAFARQASVLFIVPTHYDAIKARENLSQGIEPYVHVFTLKEKKGDAKKMWEEARTKEHPVLFITTPAGITFDRPDLDTLILERENSRVYRTLARPFIHYKVLAEKICKETGRQLVLGDSILSIESLWKEKSGEYGELSLIRWRLPSAPTKLVDVSSRPDQRGKFEIFSPELKSLIHKALEEKERIFLFGARKGLAPTTVCGDCGFVLPCLNCGAPVVLHKKNNENNIYICHACGTRRESHTVCGYCGSWKLVPLGIGIERIAAEARELFHEAKVHILDKDHAPSDVTARKIIHNFREKGGILVGTELAFFHLEKIPYTALVSADALFSIPDFNINERIFYLVSRIREMTQNESIIQTRNIGKQILAWSAQGNIIDFYLNEVGERKSLLYPPFSIFIKVELISLKSKESLVRAKGALLEWQPESYKDSIILRIPRDKWPDKDLVRTLSLLGPEFSIKVDPESIL
ncbi:hypothetical protein KW807_01660 [Candidatus Parcubacteria bacterium]|nr:hypothetical protein [Candidatus Parcubacteria bacterium]